MAARDRSWQQIHLIRERESNHVSQWRKLNEPTWGGGVSTQLPNKRDSASFFLFGVYKYQGTVSSQYQQHLQSSRALLFVCNSAILSTAV